MENNLETKYKVDKVDINGRWYFPKDKKDDLTFYFPSVTTILGVVDKGEGFHRWLGNSLSYDHAMDYGNAAAQVGSITHAYIMELLWGNKIDTKNDFIDMYSDSSEPIKVGNNVNKRLMGFIEFIKDYKPEVLANEMSLYNPRKHKKEFLYPWAGQVDQVYKIKDKIWMVDVKTGKDYKTHELQLSAYKLIWDSLYPEYKINEIAALYISDGWRKKPTYKLKKYDFTPEMWLNTLDMWNYINNFPGPSFSKEFQTEFEITEEMLNNKEKE